MTIGGAQDDGGKRTAARHFRSAAEFTAGAAGRVWAGVRGTARWLTSSIVPWVAITSAVVLLFILSGPLNRIYWHFFPPQGAIYVDSPEVYTRERLINERLEEEAWLNKQLEAAANNDDFAAIENLVRRHVEFAPDSETPVDGAGVPPPGSTTHSNTETSTAQNLVGFDDRFRLRSASRSFIRQKIIENKLDDRHDLEGNALYILKFDNTVVSAPADGRMALVRMTILPPMEVEAMGVNSSSSQITKEFLNSVRGETAQRLESIYLGWISNVGFRVNSRIGAIYSDIISGEVERITVHKLLSLLGVNSPEDTVINSLLSNPQDGNVEIVVQLAKATNRPREEVVRAIKLLSISRAIMEILGDREEDIVIDHSNPDYLQQGSFPVRFESAQHVLDITAYMNGDQAVLPSVRATPRFLQLYVLDASCEVKTTSSDVVLAGVLNDSSGRRRFSQYIIGYDTYARKSDLQEIVSFIVGEYETRLMSTDIGWQLTDTKAINYQVPYFSAVGKECDTFLALSLNVGYYNFIRSVMTFNTYSYSVLPRESTVPVLNDISNLYEYRAPKGVLGAILDTRTRGTELRPFLTTFGDVVASTTRESEGASGTATEPGTTPGSTVQGARMSPVVGWILDLGAKSPGAVEHAEFVTMNESVLAIISVPAWWTEIRLAIDKEWLNSDGKTTPASTSASDSAGRVLAVRLPNKPELIDSLLIDDARKGPIISDIDVDANPESCRDLPLLIVGQRLWRNTAVTLGSDKAIRIEVMPDMSGVIAYFQRPISAAKAETLRVWTSEGVTEMPLGAELKGKACTPQPSPPG